MGKAAVSRQETLLRAAYADFNARRLDAILARLDPAVEWANGWEGGHVTGREGVRAYWTRQWAVIDPEVEPLSIREDEAGRWIVEVRQVVRNPAGAVLVDTTVYHAYRLRGGLITHMDILAGAPGSQGDPAQE